MSKKNLQRERNLIKIGASIALVSAETSWLADLSELVIEDGIIDLCFALNNPNNTNEVIHSVHVCFELKRIAEVEFTKLADAISENLRVYEATMSEISPGKSLVITNYISRSEPKDSNSIVIE